SPSLEVLRPTWIVNSGHHPFAKKRMAPKILPEHAAQPSPNAALENPFEIEPEGRIAPSAQSVADYQLHGASYHRLSAHTLCIITAQIAIRSKYAEDPYLDCRRAAGFRATSGAPQRRRVQHAAGSESERHRQAIRLQEPACLYDGSGKE